MISVVISIFACMWGVIGSFPLFSTLTLTLDLVPYLFWGGLAFHFAWEKISKPIFVIGLGFVLGCVEICTLGARAFDSAILRPTLGVYVWCQRGGRKVEGNGQNWPDWIGHMADPIGQTVAISPSLSPIGPYFGEGSWARVYFVFSFEGWDSCWDVVFLHLESLPSI